MGWLTESRFRPKKSLGQHLLKDASYCRRIVEFAQVRPGDHVLEIGAGTGLLTRQLLHTGAQVTAVEFDRDLVIILADMTREFPGQLQVNLANVLQADWLQWVSSTPGKVVGNLPYNIATRIIRKTTGMKQKFHSFTFMVQKEVAERILARVGSASYGLFSVLMDYHFERTAGFDVPPGAFLPRPKVISHIIRLSARRRINRVQDERRLEQLLRCAFRHRRKTLANNLRTVFGQERSRAALRHCHLDPSSRPQELSLESYLCLARVL
jgi:16S rRNA (adenine1518-N6/adenine1519-N6)-dimethyltransferase